MSVLVVTRPSYSKPKPVFATSLKPGEMFESSSGDVYLVILGGLCVLIHGPTFNLWASFELRSFTNPIQRKLEDCELIIRG